MKTSRGDGAFITASALATANLPPYLISGCVPTKLTQLYFGQDEVRKVLGVPCCGCLLYKSVQPASLGKVTERLIGNGQNKVEFI